MAQLTTVQTTVPTSVSRSVGYDNVNHLGIYLGTQPGTTILHDGQSWTTVLSNSYPNGIGHVVSAYDATRGELVVVDSSTWATWTWNGTDWRLAGGFPWRSPYPGMLYPGWEYDVVYHPSIGEVVTIVPDYFANEVEVWGFDGVSWHELATQAQITSRPTNYASYAYGGMCYDPATDCLLVNGRKDCVGFAYEDKTWQWNASSGWTLLHSGGLIDLGSMLWFDPTRGAVLRGTSSTSLGSGVVYSVAVWDRMTSSWQSGTLGGAVFPFGGDYHDILGGVAGPVWPTSNGLRLVLLDDWPARYERHAMGCNPSIAPTLQLRQSSSRAWLGGTLAVELTSLTQPLALVAMGFSDTAYGATTLPLDLTTYGVPGCHLQVAPDATLLVAAQGGTASVQIAIPQWTGLLGIEFWQQGFIPAPGANAAGILVTDSTRGTIGLR